MNPTLSFSFRGLIATCFFGYLSYFLYPFVNVFDQLFSRLHSQELLPRLFLQFIKNSSGAHFEEMFSFFHIWFWILFISFVVKAIISLFHTFMPSPLSITIVAGISVVFDFFPIFIKIWSINSFDDAMPTVAVFIPTIIGCLFLYPKDENE